MTRSHDHCPEAFRHQMVDLIRSDHSPEAMAQVRVLTGYTIRNWVKQDVLGHGRPLDG